jgi:hypothetical protein
VAGQSKGFSWINGLGALNGELIFRIAMWLDRKAASSSRKASHHQDI